MNAWERVRLWCQIKLVELNVLWLLWQNARIARKNAEAKRRHRCVWRCYRDGGGGSCSTPRMMTEADAVEWVAQNLNAEVFHVDFEHRMIFYRSL